MPRPVWSGSLSFGLVNVPVTLHGAVRDVGVHFRQLHAPDSSPIEVRRVCAEDGAEVPWEEVAKGYELPDGRWILLSDEELEAAAPAKTRSIEIERFVPEREIDPIHYEHHYLVGPRDEGAARAYALLEEAMRSSGRAALGRFVLRARESLVSIRSREGALTLSTMRFHDELRPVAEIEAEIAEGAPGEPAKEQVERALAVIGELSVPFDASAYRDEHRERLLAIIERKRRGRRIAAPPAPRPEPATTGRDLMDALERSLERVREKAV
jgi:DNA end-binding protein Ku